MPAPDVKSQQGESFFFAAGPHQAGELRITSFTGRERLSKPFDLQVVVTFSGPEDQEKLITTIVGQAAWLRIEHEQAPHTIGGIVASATFAGSHTQGTSYKLRLVPTLWRLSRRKNTRIFQDLDVTTIVSMLLDEHRVVHRFSLSRKYPLRAYCVQYDETDLAFVMRLLAEEGIAFYFDHTSPPASVLVMTDSLLLTPMICGSPALLFRREMPGMPPREDHVLEMDAQRTVKPSALRVRDYDFQRPRMDLAGAATSAEKLSPGVDLDHYEHHGEYEESDARDEEATVVLEQLRRRMRISTGRTPCRRLAPGHRFTLADHEDASLDGDFLVLRVDHRGYGAGANPPGTPTYEATFRCTSAAEGLRPKRPARFVRQVVESATVTGPAGQEIHTDEYGRIRVHFHWDAKPDMGKNSCWIRVAQNWAGEGWGFQFIPRIGMEVLVTFLGGDLDRPVVIGCLPNATHPPPHPLPTGAAKSGIRTQSTPGGGGYNEIAFDDTAGSEVLSLHAQKSFIQEIGDDVSATVGGNRRTSVAGTDSLDVQGMRTVTVAAGLREEIMGDHERFVMGATKLEHFGNREVIAYAHDQARVDGSLVRTIRGDAVITTAGHATVTIGTSDMGEAQAQVSGTLVVGATKGLRLVCDERITLAVGDNAITIDSEGITLDAKNVRIMGAESVSASGPGPAMTLAEEAQISAKAIRLFAKEARVELEEDAIVKGRKVLLNCKASDPSEKDDDKKKEMKQISLRFTDTAGEPYAKKHYRTGVSGIISEGETSADGDVKVDVPVDAKIMQIRLWVRDYPEGQTKDYSITLAEELPPVDTVRGVKQRLGNLGYYDGPINDDASTLKGPLGRFQRDKGLEVTGTIDDATKAELEKVHGH
ncbi:MAG: type VI secretion system tip protein VgrG [Polyangiaceae bacterium]|nr:type VI secretion system tip protein VgrG [Polyangiaceae bacterium]